MIVRWVVGVVLLFWVLLLMLPKSDKESVTKIASASMLMCTKDLREHVARQVARREAVAAAFSNGCPDLIAELKVGELGDIVIIGNRYPLKMVLKPIAEGDKLRWSCRGEPAEAVTKLCKP